MNRNSRCPSPRRGGGRRLIPLAKKESMKAKEDGRQAKPTESDKGKKNKKSKKEHEKTLPLLVGNAKEDEIEEPKVKSKKKQHKR
jgi:hypothetical protein